jgi:hypothetical protein
MATGLWWHAAQMGRDWLMTNLCKGTCSYHFLQDSYKYQQLEKGIHYGTYLSRRRSSGH